MKTGWFDRLAEAIENDDRSLAALSRDTGAGPNFVQQMLKNEKVPSVEKLEKLLDQFDDSTSMYVVTGLKFSGDELEILQYLTSLSQDARKNALGLFRSMAAQQDAS